MYRKLTFILVVVLMSACAPAGSTGEPVSTPAEAGASQPVEAPPTEAAENLSTPEPNEWMSPGSEIAYDLCPPDKEDPITDQPVFAPAVEVELPQAAVPSGWAQYGLYANPQGELFRIDVTGVDQTWVQTYTNELHVCLDQIFSGVQAQPASVEPPTGDIVTDFGSNSEDLRIEFYLQGFFNPEEVSPEQALEETIKPLVGKPVQDWEAELDKLGWSPSTSREGEISQDYIIDFIFDPTANSGARHQYGERNAKKAWFSISVAGGSGSVKGALCRNSSWPLGRVVTVTKGGSPETDYRSDDRSSGFTTYRYDLGVKGNANGKYRVSGRYLWPGWSRAYDDPPPSGSYYSCNP